MICMKCGQLLMMPKKSKYGRTYWVCSNCMSIIEGTT